ncbi:MAG: class IV adenylate cyclase [Ardenticatenaceae bacterium]|nr:class IV adenylate cyclase [Ardenticatenaceae bacterium]
MLETEVKFFVKDHAAVRQALSERGAKLTRPRIYERNVVYDTADFQLKNSGRLLRLREDERVRLTFKGPAFEDLTSEAKIREEIEVEAAEFDPLDAIIRKIGFNPKIIYEKYRETYEWGEVEIVLDEMPYGLFVELEGDEAAIKTMAAELGLDWSKRLLTNYLALMQQLKQRLALPFDDITFENFAQAALPEDLGW